MYDRRLSNRERQQEWENWGREKGKKNERDDKNVSFPHSSSQLHVTQVGSHRADWYHSTVQSWACWGVKWCTDLTLKSPKGWRSSEVDWKKIFSLIWVLPVERVFCGPTVTNFVVDSFLIITQKTNSYAYLVRSESVTMFFFIMHFACFKRWTDKSI